MLILDRKDKILDLNIKIQESVAVLEDNVLVQKFEDDFYFDTYINRVQKLPSILILISRTSDGMTLIFEGYLYSNSTA